MISSVTFSKFLCLIEQKHSIEVKFIDKGFGLFVLFCLLVSFLFVSRFVFLLILVSKPVVPRVRATHGALNAA